MATAAKAKTKKKSTETFNPVLSLNESKGQLETLADHNRTPEAYARIQKLKAELDINDTNSVIAFGVEAQTGLVDRSDQILNGVRNKDTGPAGEVMNNLMVKIRGLGLENLNPGEKHGFLAKLFNRLTPLQKFIQKYESVEGQVDTMISKLESHKRTLERDIIMLDGMYDEALEFFNNLAFYIKAGEEKLDEVRIVDITALRVEVDNADEHTAMAKANKLRDLVEKANDLERRIHDLKLTRQVTMQMLPQLRMIQDVDKGLVTKIQSSILTTIPVWKTQIAMAITLWRQTIASKTQKAVTDATNEMILKNSKLLKENSSATRLEIERGVIDIETIKQVNVDLIETIKEAIQIAEDGHKARINASADMIQAEIDLKKVLISVNTNTY